MTYIHVVLDKRMSRSTFFFFSLLKHTLWVPVSRVLGAWNVSTYNICLCVCVCGGGGGGGVGGVDGVLENENISAGSSRNNHFT